LARVNGQYNNLRLLAVLARMVPTECTKERLRQKLFERRSQPFGEEAEELRRVEAQAYGEGGKVGRSGWKNSGRRRRE
jgi:hypothetical protein